MRPGKSREVAQNLNKSTENVVKSNADVLFYVSVNINGLVFLECSAWNMSNVAKVTTCFIWF